MSETTGTFTVVFPNHHDKLADGLWNLLLSHKAVDFDLRCGGQSIRAHRLILDVFLSPDKLTSFGKGDKIPNSPAVEAGLEAFLPTINHLSPDKLVDQGNNNHDPPVVEASTNNLASLLEFLYRGRITVDEETLDRLLELAGELDLRVLVDAIEASRNETTDTVEMSPKRRRRKGIPVKLANKDDDENSVEDPDDPPYEANPRPVVTVGVKRGRGRPRGSCKAVGDKRPPPVKRRKKRETSDSEGGESGCEGSREVKKKVKEGAVKKKRRSRKEREQDEPPLRCLHCPFETHVKHKFRIHEARHDSSVQVFRCDVCWVEFLSEEALDRHKSKKHANDMSTHSCQLCSYTTARERNLRTHMLAVHRLNAKGMPLAKTFDCSLCNFSSAFASHLANHEMTHRTDKPFQCDQCSYATIRKYDLDKHHKVVHLGQRLFLCVECGHKSASKVALNSHMRTHTMERPFICLECGKSYKSKCKLKLHTQRHQSNEKPFTCDICGFSAFRRDNLQMHMKRIHHTTLAK